MELTIKALIKHNKASSVVWNNKDLPTNKEIELTWTDYIKLGRYFDVQLLTSVKSPYNPNHWLTDKTFGFMADADSKSGFGNCTTNLLKYSALKGADVRWIGRGYDSGNLNFLSNKSIPSDIGVVWHEQPTSKWDDSPFAKNIAIVPFETTRIPASWVPRINKFDAMFVPCKQNVEMMKDSGVTIPVELIRWGVDESLFKPLQRIRTNDIFTFGTMGSLSIRKGTDLLIEGFIRAFPAKDYPNVRLICKTSSNIYPFGSKDKRISVQLTAVSHEELMRDFFQQIDCFVFPTRGEGFGLTPLEAMATGVPAIVTGWSGPADYMNEDVGWVLDYTMTPAKNFSEVIYKEDCGDWAEPSLDDLIDTMRYAYHNPEVTKAKGINAAQYVRDNWLWQNSIFAFLDALNHHL